MGPEVTDDDGGPQPRPGRLRPRMLSVVAFAVLAAGTVAGTVATHNLVDHQQRKLLEGQAQAASAVLTSSLQTTQNTLGAAGRLAVTRAVDRRSLEAVAAPLLPRPGAGQTFGAVAVFDLRGARPASIPVAGSLGANPLAVTERRATVRAALNCTPTATAACLYTSAVFPVGADRRIGFALGAPLMPKGRVSYYEVGLGPLTRTENTGKAFTDIDVILYASDAVAPGQALITTTGGTTLSGDVATSPVPVGMTNWALAASAKRTLVGAAAEAMPWILLAGGLLVALLVAVVIEILLRRRERMEQLVAERTAELTQSLGELAAAQDQLVRSERLAAIGELTSTIGHELRNPLGVLTNAMYLLRNRLEPEGDERIMRQLATADREIAAATLIVSDLLEFARSREPILEPVDLADLLTEVESVAPPPTGIAIERNLPADSAYVQADRNQLRQVFLNLVTNAYQAMPDGGTLTIGTRADGDHVTVTFADTGQGMTEETRRRIFEPFFTTRERGVGLGLAVTQRLVETHGGSIDVQSVHGAGTTFALTLPAAAQQAAAQPGGAS